METCGFKDMKEVHSALNIFKNMSNRKYVKPLTKEETEKYGINVEVDNLSDKKAKVPDFKGDCPEGFLVEVHNQDGDLSFAADDWDAEDPLDFSAYFSAAPEGFLFEGMGAKPGYKRRLQFYYKTAKSLKNLLKKDS